MHIVTGAIIAGLAGLKKRKKQPPVLKLRAGPVRTVHALPGRVRFRVSTLIGEPQKAETIKEKLVSLDCVLSVEIDPRSGSVLLAYREEEIRPELLFVVMVKLLGYEKELDQQPPPLIRKELQLLGESMNRAVYEQTGGLVDLWTALLVAMGAVGIRNLATRGLRAASGGLPLLWWALNGLKRSR